MPIFVELVSVRPSCEISHVSDNSDGLWYRVRLNTSDTSK
ncbi:unnamed protein product [Blumeria hordei]|uniref:Uncharacterized protein n=1 Tax=Blumeria hordei TaxID=2867405 RepID=A0A383UNR8_BLUHO|nr:unnamed protein product [Blumeria hordei]